MTPSPRGSSVLPPSADAASGIQPRLQRILAYRWLLGLAAAVLVLDRISKTWITLRLSYPTYGPPRAITVIEDFFYLVNVGNTGAAWSLFSGRSASLALLAVATLAAIFAWRHQLGLRQIPGQISFGLLCGGIMGNLLDRLIYKHVIDFIDLHFGSYVYPTFNIADSGICVGVILYLLQTLRQPERKDPAQP
jgi:signal peptidase II